VVSQKKTIKSATLPSTTVKSKHLLDIKLITNREHEFVSNVIDDYTIEVLTTNVQIIRFHS
jgi:transcriptional regulator CtsR